MLLLHFFIFVCVKEMFSHLVEKIKSPVNGIKGRVQGFVNPIKQAVGSLLGKLPKAKAFAGSEDLADGSTAKESDGSVVVEKVGLMARLKSFKNSLKEMSDFQKLILLTIALVLPAGILISTILVGIIKKSKKK